MAITCEINLLKSSDNQIRPGHPVRGTVRYVLSEDTLFSKITVSLKSLGKLSVTKTIYADKSQYTRVYNNKETYIDVDDEVLNNEKDIPVPAGTHEIPFSFILPENIPPTYKYNGSADGYSVYCKISYYIRVKFERPGFLKLDKRFKTKINVSSIVTPTLPTSPVTHTYEKTPFRLFNKKVISISGTVENSVTTPEGRVQISYKIDNGTKLDVKGVKITLVEETTFLCHGYFPDPTMNDKLNSCKATPLKAGEVQEMTLIIDVPPTSEVTLQNSLLVSRNYFICVVAELPLPHRNAVLRLPIQIMGNEANSETAVAENVEDSPPSYYEAMQECKKEDLD